MAFLDETYAEGRRSMGEHLLPYAAQRIMHTRMTALSEPRRFLILLVGVYSCICTSTGYVYNLFSGDLQSKYDFTQEQMTIITTLSGILGMVSLPLSYVYDYYGPKPLFVIGVLTFPLGAILFALAFQDIIPGSVAVFTIFATLLGVGNSMFDTAGLITVLSVFPSSRGAVVAVMKTFIGLGSAMFGAVQLGFFEENIAGFFYFMAAFVAMAGMMCFLVIELPPYQLTGHEEVCLDALEKRRRLETKQAYFEQVPPARRFAMGFMLVCVFIVFLPTQSVLIAYLNLSHWYKVLFAVITAVLLLGYSVIALPIRWLDGGSEDIVERIHIGQADAEAAAATNSPSHSPLRGSEAGAAAACSTSAAHVSALLASTRGSVSEEAIFRMPVIDEVEHIAPQYQTAFVDSIRTPELWAFSYSLFCIIGAQVVIIGNARFIYAAVAEEPISSEMATLLTVFNGVGSAVGRILMSLFEVWTQKRRPEERVPLTIGLYIPSVAVLLSSAFILVASKRFLLIPFIFTALANGFTAAVIVLIMRTLYAKDIANHYNFASIASLAASIFLNQLLYGKWYTREAERQNQTLCLGRQCIFFPFAIMSLLAFSSLFTNSFLHYRYGVYCKAVMERRHPSHYSATMVVGEGADPETEPLLHSA